MAGVGWAGVAQAYAAAFAPLCAGAAPALLEAAAPPPGSRVLDAGTGTGTLAALAGERGCRVTAVDPDPEMLALAAATAPQAQLVRAGLPDLPLADAAYDAVLAGFVVNHLPDPRAGVRELARVCAPGGRVAVTVWPSGQNAQSRLWQQVLDATGVVPAAGTRLPEHLDFARTADGLGALLEEAGLVDVDSRPLAWTHRTEPDAPWRGAAAGVGGIGTTVTSQTARTRERMRAAYDEAVLALVEDGRLRLDTEAVLAVGTRPA